MDEYPLDPWSHFVSLWRTEVDVEDNDGDAYTVCCEGRERKLG